MQNSGLNEILERLKSGTAVRTEDWPEGDVMPHEFGFFEGTSGLLSRRDDELDLLDIPLLQSMFDADFGLQFRHCHSTGSTNSDLLELGRSRSLHNVVHLTEYQSSGRGRRGRMWLSPYARSLAFSFGFETAKSVFELQGLSLAVGVAVCSSLRSLGAFSCGLKWPNDVITSDGKLAGILVEHQMRNDVSQFVIGVGVNVALSNREKFSIAQPVVDLRELGVASNRTMIAMRIIQSIYDHVRRFVEEDKRSSIQAFKDLHFFQNLECSLVSGDSSINGRVVDVADDGSLVMSIDGERRSFISGEVSLRPLSNN